ncbi:MAG: HU family DNA-binding protein [Prevotella sp.]|nr:HU family DNA-binding protein [Prevotella sp.]
MVKSSLRRITESVAKKQKLPVEDIEKFITALFEVTDEGLHADKQVKIKGLGTFKITTVKPRESVNVNTGERVLINSHDKVAFTPDASMKELVNKPFAQFKTVVVNDGVDIAKLETTEQLEEEKEKDNSPEPEKTEEVQESVESEAQQPATTVVDEAAPETKDVEVSREAERLEPAFNAEEAKQEESEPVAVPTPREVKAEPLIQEKPVETRPKRPMEPAFNAEEAKQEESEPVAVPTPREVKAKPVIQEKPVEAQPKRPISPAENAPLRRQKRHYWLAISLVVAFILGIAIFSYNSFQTTTEQPKVAMKPAPKANTKTSTRKTKAPQPPKEADDPYAVKPMAEYMKDPRIKYGAYDIVGIDKIVTLREGQTLQSVCNSTLGSYMICYFEAVNPDKNPKAGDKVRIPKVKIRKRN